MPNTALTTERIAEEIRLMLGGSEVEVELSDATIKSCATRTLRVYNRYIPFRGRAALTATSGQKRYRIDNLHTGLIGVVDVQFLSRRVQAAVDPFDPFMLTVFSQQSTLDTTFGDIALMRAYAEDAQRVTGAEPDWHGQWETVSGAQQYALYVDVPSTNLLCGYSFRCAYQDTDSPATGRLAIPETDIDWFINYTAALAKQLLARVRGKHGGVMTSEGSTDPTDSDSDRAEASAELEALTNEIKMRKPPFLPQIE